MSIIRTNTNNQFENVREYFSEIEKMDKDILSHEKTIILFREYRENGNLEARDQLITSNLRLVNKYALSMMNSRHDALDLIQEGNLGLIKAIEKFDYTSGIKFSSYAVTSIKQNIRRYMYANRTIRIPEHIAIALSQIKHLEDKLGRQLTLSEAKKATKMNKANIEHVMSISNRSMESYDYNENNEGDSVLSTISDNTINSFDSVMIRNEISDKIFNILSSVLDEREMLVICERFALTGGEPKSLQDIGNIIGRTRELVRRIEMKGLDKIKSSIGCMKYSDFIIEEETF